MTKTSTVDLKKIAGKATLLGNELGRQVFNQLHQAFEGVQTGSIVEISLANIEATDASFPRESVISIAKLFCGEIGFFLSGFRSRDLLDNWDYAAKAKEQALIVEHGPGKYGVIGPELSGSLKEVLEFALKERTVTTSKVATKFDLSAPNASAKLKKLHQIGLVLGTKETAETGGLEYVYYSVRRS